ncbi:MAG: deoxyribose-phosphate aldolase [Verrucomicrobia bacterium]|nr:deoxyribose-phosphate aldolase [Cytophagales bacterium]
MKNLTELHLLHPTVLDNDIDKAALLAVKSNLAGLCVPPYWVKKASRETKNTLTSLITVIGYPFGYQRTEAKQAEAELAFTDGVDEIELVLNLSAIKSDRMNWIKAEIARFAKLVHAQEKMLTVSVPFENLTGKELEKVCQVASEAGTDYLKNSSFSAEKITISQIKTFRQLTHQTVALKIFIPEADEKAMKEILDLGIERICVAQFS